MSQAHAASGMVDTSPILSICIPTYNRAAFLPALLDSILSEIDGLTQGLSGKDVEIVISDNNSTDDTDRVVAFYQELLPRLVFLKQTENIGADRNYIAAIAASSGTFSWLMGSDDRVEAGGVAHVLSCAQRFQDAAGFTIGVKGYDSRFEAEMAIADSVDLDTATLIEGAEEAYAVFIEQFGFISAQIVRRELWQAICETHDFTPYLNAYVHLFIIGKMLQDRPCWGYTPQVCVGWRSGNDSFLQDGWLKRMNLDVVGYGNATAGVFGKDSLVSKKVRNRIAGSHIYRHYIFAKSHDASSASLKQAARIIYMNYVDTKAYWTKLFPLIVTPAPVLRLARHVYRQIRYLAGRR